MSFNFRLSLSEVADLMSRDAGDDDELLADFRSPEGEDALDEVPDADRVLPPGRCRAVWSDSDESQHAEDRQLVNAEGSELMNAEATLEVRPDVIALAEKELRTSQLMERLVKVETEEYLQGYGPLKEIEDAERLAAERRQVSKKPKTRRAKSVYYLSGRSSSTSESLDVLRAEYNISAEVELLVPEPDDRAESPPAGYFTLYESFFIRGLLWFPIPEVMTEYLFRHKASFAQLTPRAIRHLVGLLVRSYECGIDLTVDHYLALLRFAEATKNEGNVYFLTNRPNRRVIHGFPSKDTRWSNHYFYVQISRASVGRNVPLISTSWDPIGRSSKLVFLYTYW